VDLRFSIISKYPVPLHWRSQLCHLLLLWRGLPVLEDSLAGSSAAMGMAKSLGGCGGGSTEGKAERDRLEIGNLTIRKNNWKA
jgi:hypothetical protein